MCLKYVYRDMNYFGINLSRIEWLLNPAQIIDPHQILTTTFIQNKKYKH